MRCTGFGFRGKADLGHGFWNSSRVIDAAFRRKNQKIRRSCGEGKVYYGAGPPPSVC